MSEARRVAVPKKFLTELGEQPVIAKWYEDCLILVGNNFWEGLSKRLTAERNTFELGIRDIERFVLGSAFEIEADEQGRIIIPETLAKYAGLTKEITFVGLIDRVEIWDKTVWEEKSKGLEKVTREYIEKLANNVKTKH
jgi:MraZ protein